MKGPAKREMQQEDIEEPSKVELATEHLKTLPAAACRRLYAMEQLQKEFGRMEAQYHEELDALERKYLGIAAPIYNKRAGLITGEYEPTESELTGYTADPAAPTTDVKGIPLFWYHALNNNDTVHQLTGMTERDKEALAYLVDVRYDLLPRTKGPSADGTKEVIRHGFNITFTFAPNEFFSDRVLVKTYHLNDDDSGEPMFDSAEATKPNWLPGKNLTVRVVKKAVPKPKRGARGGKAARGASQLQSVEEPCESFFQFFNPPQLPTPGDQVEPDEFEELSDAVQADFEIGCEIRDNICPKAVLWFNGQAIEEDDEDGEDWDEDDEDDDDEDGLDEDDDDEEDDDDDDDDDEPKPTGGKKSAAAAKFAPPPGQQPAPECKQQ